MDSTSLGLLLSRFLKSKSERSLLIDGPWGCGKTYQVRHFLEKNKDKPIFYLSVFGKDNIDSINEALYSQIHSTGEKVEKGLTVVGHLVSVLPYCGGVSDALDYCLSGRAHHIKRPGIVIFDDLERISPSLSYISLLGFFNSLYMSGLRIIGIYSATQINDQTRRKEFSEFKEKVFDRIYSINDSNDKAIVADFKRFHIEGIETVVPQFENNFRIVQRTERIYEIVQRFLLAKKGSFPDGVTPLQLLKCCLAVEKLVFSDHLDEKPVFEKDDFYSEIAYKENFRRYGENIANGLLKTFGKDGGVGVLVASNLSPLVDAILLYYLYDDPRKLESFFGPKPTGKEDLLSENFYYLSDKNKEKYGQLFFEKVEKKEIDFSSDEDRNRLGSILYYSDHELSSKNYHLLAKALADGCLSGKYNLSRIEFSLKRLGEDYDAKGEARLAKVIAEATAVLSAEKEQKIKEKLILLYQNRKFASLNDLLVSLTNEAVNPSLVDFVAAHHFFLPDLSENIDEGKWGYAHESARFARWGGKSKEFIDELKRQIIDHPKSECQFDRAKALVWYNIDSNYDFSIFERLRDK